MVTLCGSLACLLCRQVSDKARQALFDIGGTSMLLDCVKPQENVKVEGLAQNLGFSQDEQLMLLNSTKVSGVPATTPAAGFPNSEDPY